MISNEVKNEYLKSRLRLNERGSFEKTRWKHVDESQKMIGEGEMKNVDMNVRDERKMKSDFETLFCVMKNVGMRLFDKHHLQLKTHHLKV